MQLNKIDVKLEPILAHQSAKWKQKDTSKVKDYAEIEKTADWSFSSPYKGQINSLK